MGSSQLSNTVQAVANAVPPYPIPWYNGNALVSTMPHCKPNGWAYDAFTIGGGSNTIVRGAGGIFVNSDCDRYAFTSSSNSSIDSTSGICVVGGAYQQGWVNPPVDHDCSAVDPNLYQTPAVDLTSCPQPGTITTLSPGNYLATPGYYNSTFPNVTPSGTLLLAKGIYCLKNGLNINSQWTVTTDIDGNGTFDGTDGADEGVLFYVPSGGITFNGGANVQVASINKAGTSPGIKGYLIYLPKTNNSPVTVSGNNGSEYRGTILAPASLVTLEGAGSGSSMTFECNVIGYSIRVTGGGILNLTYNQGVLSTTYTNPQLKPYR